MPGVGIIRMKLAGARLGASAINVYAKKHEGEIKWFVNGFATGYLMGNIIGIVSRKSIWKHLTDEPEAKLQAVTTPSPPEPTQTVAPTPMADVISTIDPSAITINLGDVIDVNSMNMD